MGCSPPATHKIPFEPTTIQAQDAQNLVHVRDGLPALTCAPGVGPPQMVFFFLRQTVSRTYMLDRLRALIQLVF